LGIKICAIFDKSHKTYGIRRIKAALASDGIRVGRRLIKSKMDHYGLVCKAAKRYKATTNSKHNLPVAPNLLEQNFVVSAPNKVWVTDFTYLWTLQGWMYLAVVLDLYSRRIVGWSMSNRMTKELVIEALEMAIRQRKPAAGLIVHSDRGSQYCSHEYQKRIKRYQLCCSMSKKGDCYDNACAETFFHSFKVEWIYGYTFLTREECRQSARSYIEVFYNRQRLHSYLGYRTPCQFEQVA
jgi:putative transposase